MTAQLLGTLRPQIYRFKLGAVEITTLLDGALVRDAISPPYAIGESSEAIAAQAAANFLPADKFEHVFTVTIVNTGSQVVLFDTGNGADRRGAGMGFLRELLPAAGYSPNDIDVVAFTHGHPDHILGVREGDELAFPNARYVIGQVEFDAWKTGNRIPEQRQENRDMFLRLIVPLAENTTFLKPDDEVVPGIRAVEAFGHSIGHMAYRVESEGKSVLVWGDVTNHYVFSLQQPDWQVAFDDDKQQATATRKRILDMVATDRLTVIGFHMPFPSVGFVERASGSYRWVPESYQMRV